MAPETDSQHDLQALRARVAELERVNGELEAARERLERENAELAARTNAAVAAVQERVYWLDRWHLDLNALMRKPGAGQARGLVRALRAVVRALKKVRRRLLS